MNIIDIITKKKNKEELTRDEIEFTVKEFVNGNIKDYQMSSLLMAIVLNDMNFEETYNLTEIMLNSGDIIDLSKVDGIKVDKHSTGGVGDKTSLVVLPLAASCGIKIAKMSGRGLGFTGGTIDKLESIEGFKTSISEKAFIDQVNKINIALVSQSGNLVPADKKIYALRDVTGTTESIPLIASSIMSKKLASGSDKILLDVKVGKGAFMKDLPTAKKLAKTMVKIGKRYGKDTVAVLTNMDYPLGYTIGNGLEVVEAVETLDGKGEKDFTNLCLLLASYMVSLGKNIGIDEAYEEVLKNYNNKNGLRKLNEFVSMQGGDLRKVKLEKNKIEIVSKKSGYITDIDTIGLASLTNSLGAGRNKKDDLIKHGVGVKMYKKINDYVYEGETLLKVYTDKEINEEDFRKTYKIDKTRIKDYEIIYEIVK